MITRGPHQYILEHTSFTHKEFSSMVTKFQWVMLPYLVYLNFTGLRLIPLGVK